MTEHKCIPNELLNGLPPDAAVPPTYEEGGDAKVEAIKFANAWQ